MTSCNPATIPVKIEDVQGDRRWESLHEEFCHQSHDKEADIVFIGWNYHLSYSIELSEISIT